MNRSSLKSACEEIDAEIFSGDVLFNKEDTAELKEYIQSWSRAIETHETTMSDKKEKTLNKHAKFFELFIEEVRLTYGEKISNLCLDKLNEQPEDLNPEFLDETAILEEAKKEAGFSIENSSLGQASRIIG